MLLHRKPPSDLLELRHNEKDLFLMESNIFIRIQFCISSNQLIISSFNQQLFFFFHWLELQLSNSSLEYLPNDFGYNLNLRRSLVFELFSPIKQTLLHLGFHFSSSDPRNFHLPLTKDSISRASSNLSINRKL